MASEQLREVATAGVTSSRREAVPEDYPVREYIAGMTRELAQMARWDGDEVLAGLLEAAVLRAEGSRP